MNDNTLKWIDKELEQLIHDVKDTHAEGIAEQVCINEVMEKINAMKVKLGGEEIVV